MPTVTIIVVTYNSAETIALCLDSIFNQTLASEQIEIIVVDNHSEDETHEIICRHNMPVNLITLEKNIGFGQANNIALTHSHAPFVALVNPDCELHRDWLENILDFIQSDEKIAIVGSKIFFTDGQQLQHVGGMVHDNGVTSHIGVGELDVGQYETPQHCDYVTAVAVLCRRTILQAVTYFDPQYFMYYEETDLCYRIQAMGWDVRYCPRACAIHHEHSSLGHRASLRYLFLYHISRLKFIAKHRQHGLFPNFLRSEYQWLLTPIGKRLRMILLVVYVMSLFNLIQQPNRNTT